MLARDGRILVSGYNGTPAGMLHCKHSPDEANDRGCIIAVHAEANAIAYAARWGIKVEGAELHTTCTPCLNCAMLIINAGIVRVVAAEKYRDPAGELMLQEAGIVLA